MLLVEELQKHGATVEFLDRPMSQDPHDQLLLQIRGAVAEYERTLITERMRRGRLRRLKAGTLLPWTQAPFGYCLDPDHPRHPAGVRVDETQAAIVREIFAWDVEGITITAMIQRLARLGIALPADQSRLHGSGLCQPDAGEPRTDPVQCAATGRPSEWNTPRPGSGRMDCYGVHSHDRPAAAV